LNTEVDTPGSAQFGHAPVMSDGADPSLTLVVLYAAQLGGFALFAMLPELVPIPAATVTSIFRLLVVLVSLASVFLCVRQMRPLHASYLWLVLALIWFMLLLRLAYDVAMPGSPYPRPPNEYVAIAIGACIIPMLAMLEVPSRRTCELGWFMALIVTAASCIMLLLLFASGSIALSWASRLSTTVLNPITIGYLGANMVVLSATAPFSWHRHGFLWRFLGNTMLFTIAAAGALLTVASGSRGPMIALVLTTLVWMAISPVKRTARSWRVLARIVIVVGGTAGLVVVALVVGELLGINPFERFLWILSDASTSYREQAVSGALLQFAGSPIIGDRVLEQTTFDYPHNVLVEALMATGVVGGLALAIYMTYAAVSSLRIIRRNVSCQWLGMCCLIQLFASVTSGSLYLSDTFWTLSAATIAMSSRRKCRLEWNEADESAGMPLSRSLLNRK
jgi:hypothetical protein